MPEKLKTNAKRTQFAVAAFTKCLTVRPKCNVHTHTYTHSFSPTHTERQKMSSCKLMIAQLIGGWGMVEGFQYVSGLFWPRRSPLLNKHANYCAIFDYDFRQAAPITEEGYNNVDEQISCKGPKGSKHYYHRSQFFFKPLKTLLYSIRFRFSSYCVLI